MKIPNLFLLSGLLFIGCNAAKQAGKSSMREDNGVFSLHLPNQVMEIDPASGAKVSALKIDGYNFLTDSLVHREYWGSSFWLSPESVWSWSEKEIDQKRYTSRIQKGKIVMRSPESIKTGLTITKEFSSDPKSKSFIIEYTITNVSDSVKDLAPWEVTRVHTDGIAFFPFGEGKRRGGLLPFTVENEHISWYQYRAEEVPLNGDRQLYSDGSEGWLAEVNGQTILIQRFADLPLEKNAPEEGEVEWYASPVAAGKSYVEVEHQGPYTHLQSGQSLIWKSEWFLRKLPSEIKPEVGNSRLVDYVRKIVNQR